MDILYEQNMKHFHYKCRSFPVKVSFSFFCMSILVCFTEGISTNKLLIPIQNWVDCVLFFKDFGKENLTCQDILSYSNRIAPWMVSWNRLLDYWLCMSVFLQSLAVSFERLMLQQSLDSVRITMMGVYHDLNSSTLDEISI